MNSTGPWKRNRTAAGGTPSHLTYWLENVAVHHLRENTHTRYTTCVNRYLIPSLGKKNLAKAVRTFLNRLRTTCQCRTTGIDARTSPATAPLASAATSCSPR